MKTMRSRLCQLLVTLSIICCVALCHLQQCMAGEDDEGGLRIQGKVDKLPNGKLAIHLRWHSTRDDVSSYEVEEKPVDGSGTNFRIVFLAPGGHRGEFIETEIVEGTDYDFRIRADYDNGTVSDYR